MDKKKMLLGVATILGTCADIRQDAYIEGYVYAGLMGNFTLDEFHRVMDFLVHSGTIERLGGHMFAVTEKGYAMGEKFNEALKSQGVTP